MLAYPRIVFLLLCLCASSTLSFADSTPNRLDGCRFSTKTSEFRCGAKSLFPDQVWPTKRAALISITAGERAPASGTRKPKLPTDSKVDPSNENGGPAEIPLPYSRHFWGDFKDLDGDCLNSRDDILAERSLTKAVIKKCKVVAGKWNDFYFAEILTNPALIDIDHVVPLKHAHDLGGWRWSAEKRLLFANDFDNLVITNRHYNRQKGASDLTNWSPSNHAYACKYLHQWMLVKHKYELPVTAPEIAQEKLLACDRIESPQKN